jgi:poly(A) polymerase
MNAYLPDAPWRHNFGLGQLLIALGGHRDETRFVGGAVRDTLLGLAVSDVDLATIHPPSEVIDRLRIAGIKAVPTGIDHGTITAVVDSRPYEVTTLRSDVSTDGRRATVAFTQDWTADAARRDFTINALYAHTHTGEIHDYFGGLDDLSARHVRFIGKAEDRIAEDHLRILRFFRFFARYGSQEVDAQAYAACCAQANSLMALSRERIADELLKLLAAPDPLTALTLMIEGSVLLPVLPEITAESLIRLRHLIVRESAAGLPPSALLRLCALLPRNAVIGDGVAARLKLSNKARKRLTRALEMPPPYRSPTELAYRLGAQAAQDIILLDDKFDPAIAASFTQWEPPHLSVGGASLIALGMQSGPQISRALMEIKEQWIAEDFPATERTREITERIVSSYLRDASQ